MQFADRYVIEATNSASAGKFINHGCPGAANARTQIMITPTEIYMGIVAKRVIAPEEEIVLDYCGACHMPPSLHNASLAQFGIEHCHCDTCARTSSGPSEKVQRPKRARPIIQSSQSSTTSSQPSRPAASPLSAHSSQTVTQTQHSIVQQASRGADAVPALRTKGRVRSPSTSSSSTTTLGQRPKASTDSPGTNYIGKGTKTTRKESSKHSETNPTPKDNRNTTRESAHGHGARGDIPRVDLIQSQVGKPRQVGETILMPLVCLLSAQVAQKTHPEVFAAAKRIVLKLTTSQSHVHGFMKLTPIGFSMQTNLVGCAAAFLPKAIRNLQSWETNLGPGVIGQLAQRYNTLNLGDQIYDLLLTTQLFKSKMGHEGTITRDTETFPLAPRTPTTVQGTLQTHTGSDDSANALRAPSYTHPPHSLTPQRSDQVSSPQQRYGGATYAQALTNTAPPSMDSNTPPSAPATPPSTLAHNSPSPTISSLSGASTSTTARSALLAPPGNRTSPQTTGADGPPLVWQTAMTSTMQMLTELITRFPPPMLTGTAPDHHAIHPRPAEIAQLQETAGSLIDVTRNGKVTRKSMKGTETVEAIYTVEQNNRESQSRATALPRELQMMPHKEEDHQPSPIIVWTQAPHKN